MPASSFDYLDGGGRPGAHPVAGLVPGPYLKPVAADGDAFRFGAPVPFARLIQPHPLIGANTVGQKLAANETVATAIGGLFKAEKLHRHRIEIRMREKPVPGGLVPTDTDAARTETQLIDCYGSDGFRAGTKPVHVEVRQCGGLGRPADGRDGYYGRP